MAISAMMVLMNEMEKTEKIGPDDFKKFLQILAPFAPNITEELWQQLQSAPRPTEQSFGRAQGRTSGTLEDRPFPAESIHLSSWPVFDPAKIVDEEMKIMIQVNGKVRGEIIVPADTEEDAIKEQAQKNEKVLPWLAGKTIAKIIYVKNKLVSIVVSE